MANTKKITFWGGFHDATAISIRVSEDIYNRVKYKVEHKEQYLSNEIYEDLSPYQLKRLQKHFCPFKDCQCGGIYFRTTKVEFNND